MEFGDRTRFAIDIVLDEDCGGAWLFGRFCYWIAGAMVGNFDEGTSLRDVLFQMKYIKNDSGKRCFPELFALPEKEIFSLISRALDETSNEIFEIAKQELLPARLDVRIPVDLFDLWKIYLVEDVCQAKIIFGRIDSSILNFSILGAGEFDATFGKAYEYLNALYEATISG